VKRISCGLLLALLFVGQSALATTQAATIPAVPQRTERRPVQVQKSIGDLLRWIEERLAIRPRTSSEQTPPPTPSSEGNDPVVCPVPLERGHCPVG